MSILYAVSMSETAKSSDAVRWLTVTEAADRLGVDGRTVRRWIQELYFPNAVRSSPRQGRYLIPESDIETFEQNRKVVS